MSPLKQYFLFDPQVIFLNHGSFGATPRPVFEAYQQWQRRLEAQPVQFLSTELAGHLQTAREALAATLQARPEDIVYLPNATFGVNVVAHSLALGPGDEVLATDHEYGACANVWRYYSQKRGFGYRVQPIPLPASSAADIAGQLWQGVTPHTRVIFLSHITSSTALILPVAEICARARRAGILTVIDGAHTPGQLPLDLPALEADFYAGNCHKWLCSPKGAGFLYARRERQGLIEPLVVGWGWGEERAISYGSDFLDYLQWLGTNDLSAYLSVPAAIAFQEEHRWEEVRARCHTLLRQALARLQAVTGQHSLYHDVSQYRQMAAVRLPPETDVVALKNRLYQNHRIEIPCGRWNGDPYLRLSLQGYNDQADVDALLAALPAELAACQGETR